MGKTTEIQWCDSTVNPTTGCDGCELWSEHGPRTCDLYDKDFTQVRLAKGRMVKAAAWSDLAGTDRPDKPWLNGMPRTIFVGDMGDILSRDISYEYIEREVIANAASQNGQRHIWMILTKRAARLSTLVTTYGTEAGSWPKNVWVGTSVTDQKTVDSRIPYLCATPGATRFVSAEPLYGPITVDPKHLAMIDMIIVGGESGGMDSTPFDINWIHHIEKQVKGTNCKLFVKQLGSYPYEGSRGYGLQPQFVTLRDSHGGDWNEWPDDLRRREFPGGPMLRYVNAKQAAVILGCRPSTVHSLANRGLLTRHEIKPYHAQYRYNQDEVERLAEQPRKTKPEISPKE